MRLESMQGSVEVSIVGYEYPGLEVITPGPDWDANYLVVRGTAQTKEVSWMFEAPCITTWEANELEQWLRTIATSPMRDVLTAQSAVMSFTEPHLAFELEELGNGNATLTVAYAYAGSEVGPDPEGVSRDIRLTIPLDELALAADAWKAECSRFPVR